MPRSSDAPSHGRPGYVRAVTRWLLLLAMVAPMIAQAAVPGGARRIPRAGMVRIPAGSYRAPFGAPSASASRVSTFLLDRTVVTRAAFAEFLRAHPRWRPATAETSLTEDAFRREWSTESYVPRADDDARPATRVSWHAASAFCAVQGKRLPTTDEWEFAAAASESARDGSSDLAFRSRLLALYSARRPGMPSRVGSTFRNAYGVDDMHGLVWELTEDVGTPMRAGMTHRRPDVHAAHDRSTCAAAAIGVADPSNYAAFLRYTVRGTLTPRTVQDGLGFRCAAGG